jgi:5-enolpyruvylshikimate-3-phosphate synthase
MAFAIAALFVNGPSTLDNDNIVCISCPNFFDLLAKIKA